MLTNNKWNLIVKRYWNIAHFTKSPCDGNWRHLRFLKMTLTPVAQKSVQRRRVKFCYLMQLKSFQSHEDFTNPWVCFFWGGDLHPGAGLKVCLRATVTAADGKALFFMHLSSHSLSSGSTATETQLIWDFTEILCWHAPAPYPLDACHWAGASPVCH